MAASMLLSEDVLWGWEVPAQAAWDSQLWHLFQGAVGKVLEGVFCLALHSLFRNQCWLYFHVFLFPQMWMRITKKLMEWIRGNKIFLFSWFDHFCSRGSSGPSGHCEVSRNRGKWFILTPQLLLLCLGLDLGLGHLLVKTVAFLLFFLLPMSHFMCKGAPSPQDFAVPCTCLKTIRSLGIGESFSTVPSTPCPALLGGKAPLFILF